MRPVGEIEFANGVAAMCASGGYGVTRACAGIVGHGELTLGARVRPVLEAMIAAGNGRFRGIRFITASDPDQGKWGAVATRPQGWLLDKTVREGFAQLAPLGLSFDAFMFHPQLGDLTDLARAFPQTPIVLNHVGGPIGLGRFTGKRDEVFADWRAKIRELAACPNVHVKLGGMGMKMFGFDFHEHDLPPDSERLAAAWRPYVESCIEAFGASRAMFESNFPVDKGSYGYGVFWNACKRLAQGASAAEKADLFHGTASRVLRARPAGMPSALEQRRDAIQRGGGQGGMAAVHHRDLAEIGPVEKAARCLACSADAGLDQQVGDLRYAPGVDRRDDGRDRRVPGGP